MIGSIEDQSRVDVMHAEGLMARDAENLVQASDGEGRIFIEVYHFARPSITAGRNARVTDEELERWRELGHDFARRPTGGGVLRHEDDISFGVAIGAGISSVSFYHERVSEALRGALMAQEIETAVATSTGAAAPGCCFAGAVGHELLYRGEKLVGLAARKVRGAVLIQGSIAVRRNAPADLESLGVGPAVDLSDTEFDEQLFAMEFRRRIALQFAPALG